MRFYFSLLLILVFFGVNAQPLFTLTPDTVFASKPASNFTMYNYAAFNNLSGDTLAMRWVKTQTLVQQTVGHGEPGFGNWTISLQDPENFYNPAMQVDSADFTLLPISGSTDKFILQLYPNGQEGTLQMTFKIFAVNYPEDFVEVLFEYTATPATTNVVEPNDVQQLEAFPNPTTDWLLLRNNSYEPMSVKLFSSTGTQIQTLSLKSLDTIKVDLSMLSPGLYFLASDSRIAHSNSFFIKN